MQHARSGTKHNIPDNEKINHNAEKRIKIEAHKIETKPNCEEDLLCDLDKINLHSDLHRPDLSRIQPKNNCPLMEQCYDANYQNPHECSGAKRGFSATTVQAIFDSFNGIFIFFKP